MAGVLGRPVFVVPAVLAGAAAEIAIHVNGWPTRNLDAWPVERQFTIALLVLLARAWFDLTLVAVGIAIVRGRSAGILTNWVHVLTAIKIGVVGVLLLAGVLLGTLLFVLPGVYLLLRWSQVLPALVEQRTGVGDVFMYSESIASAHYLRILVIWIALWGVTALISLAGGGVDHLLAARGLRYLGRIELGVSMVWPAVLHALGLALVAALYVELDARAYVKAPAR